MAQSDYLRHISLSPAPLDTPLNATSADQTGIPFQFRSDDAPANVDLHPAWAAHFNKLYERVSDLPGVIDTHAHRLTPTTNPAPTDQNPPYLPDRYLGMFYWETDRRYLYFCELVDNLPAWVYILGLMRGVATDRPTDLGANDLGALFLDVGVHITFRWNGAYWLYDSGTYIDVFANRPSTLGPHDYGYLFQASDWGTVTWKWIGSGWLYVSGTWSGTQATLPAGLGADDAGLLAYVTDYDHTLMWNGTGWQFAQGDSGSGMLQFFAVQPTGVGWHICDGSTVQVLRGDGTLAGLHTPNVHGTGGKGTYLRADPTGYAPAIVDPVSPTVASGLVFTGTPLASHTHETAHGESGTTVSHLSGFGTGTSHTADRTLTSTAGSGTVAADLTSAVSAGTPAGTISPPVFDYSGGDPVPNAFAYLFIRL